MAKFQLKCKFLNLIRLRIFRANNYVDLISSANYNNDNKMRKARVKVVNSKGLHARAAARLAKVASDYISIVRVGQTKMVDGKSILSLMMLAAIKGTVLKIETEGIDEDIAIEAIINLVKGGFDEVN